MTKVMFFLSTIPPQAIMRLMLVNHIRTDSVRQLEEEQEPLYTEDEMQRCLDKIEVSDYHQVRSSPSTGCYSSLVVVVVVVVMVPRSSGSIYGNIPLAKPLLLLQLNPTYPNR